MPKLTKEFGYKNPLEVPRLDKIVLNMGVGEAVNDTKKVTSAAADLSLIAGQKPVVTRARKAISTFKVRENMPIGAKVTLRKTRMYEFLDRLVTVALPRVRDFRGLDPKSFDGRGNYALGVKEHIIFPEIDYDKAEAMLGLDIVVCTTAKTDAEAQGLAARVQLPVPAVSLIQRSDAENGAHEWQRRVRLKITCASGGWRRNSPRRRKRLLDVANDQARPMEERFEARIRLAALPRNGAIIRVRNRCEVTGRPRGFYRKMKMSRIAVRELGNQGLIPGLVKSSW